MGVLLFALREVVQKHRLVKVQKERELKQEEGRQCVLMEIVMLLFGIQVDVQIVWSKVVGSLVLVEQGQGQRELWGEEDVMEGFYNHAVVQEVGIRVGVERRLFVMLRIVEGLVKNAVVINV